MNVIADLKKKRRTNRIYLLLILILARGGPSTAQNGQVFFGNLHSHTKYSDGSGTPDDAYKRARDVAHLDFLAITEYNHSQAEAGASADRKDGILIAKDHRLYEGPQTSALIPAARRFTEDGKFVAFDGQEFSSISKGNHANVFKVENVIDDQTIPNGRFDLLVNTWLPNHLDTGQPRVDTRPRKWPSEE